MNTAAQDQFKEFTLYADTLESLTINEMSGVTEFKMIGVKRLGSAEVCSRGTLIVRKVLVRDPISQEIVPAYGADVSGQEFCETISP